MYRLRNPIRRSAWGSRTVIAGLQGRPVPSPEPEAELWIGAHPANPSTVSAGGGTAELPASAGRQPAAPAGDGLPLTDLIAANPVQILGEAVYGQFGARLPYLLKLLAADAPLSLQAHPDTGRAAAGYEAEEAAGVPRDARHRRYVDPYHKPELLVAVSRFVALCGFRDPAASAELLAGLGVPALAPAVAALREGDLAGAVRWLLTHPSPAGLVAAVVDAGAPSPASELASSYADDVGVVVALLLNLVTLAPGEAIFMPAGNLHAYLHGTGVELMAASDNVLRGGLTPKHVDVPELLRVLRFEPLVEPVRRPVPVGPGVVTWPVPVSEFALHRVRLDGDVARVELALAGPRTVLCLAGWVEAADGVGSVTLRAGETGFAGAGRPLVLTGAGEAYVASVPDGTP
jgi:mannose-6-phosphate isomerase